MPETLAELKLRLELLRSMGVSHHDPTSGAVTLFAPTPAAMRPLTKEEMLELADKRAEQEAALEQRRKFGAAGGFQPNQVSRMKLRIGPD